MASSTSSSSGETTSSSMRVPSTRSWSQQRSDPSKRMQSWSSTATPPASLEPRDPSVFRPLHPDERIQVVIRPSSSIGDGPMLAPQRQEEAGRQCLVLDLDETLVHSSFKPVPKPDYVIPIEIEGAIHYVYVLKRPGCDEFLKRMGELFEVVVFTASLSKYADPLLDLLDGFNVIRARLFREACVHYQNSYVKDLSLLGRSAKKTILLDNSPVSYMFQQDQGLPCTSFIDDPRDKELYVLADFLESIVHCVDVRQALDQWTNGTYKGPHGLELHPRKLSLPHEDLLASMKSIGVESAVSGVSEVSSEEDIEEIKIEDEVIEHQGFSRSRSNSLIEAEEQATAHSVGVVASTPEKAPERQESIPQELEISSVNSPSKYHIHNTPVVSKTATFVV